MHQISRNAFLLCARADNPSDADETVGGALTWDMGFNYVDDAACFNRPSYGFEMRKDGLNLYAVVRNAPLVTDVDTYWFGASGHQWEQVQASEVGGGSSASVYGAFSWQNREVPANGSVCWSAIIRAGLPEWEKPVVTVLAATPDTLDCTSTMWISGSVSSEAHGTIRLFLVIDGNTFDLIELGSGLGESGSFTEKVDLTGRVLSPGDRTFSLYAVDAGGVISEGASFQRTLLGDSTPCPLPASPTPAQSMTPSASRTPFPLVLTQSSEDTFRLYGIVDGVPEAIGGQWDFFNSHIETQVVNRVTQRLSVDGQYTPRLVVTWTLDNPDVFPQKVRCLCHCLAQLFFLPNLAVHALDIRGGFEMRVATATLTFLLTNHAEVTPVSAYWFGYVTVGIGYFWQQTTSTVSTNANILSFSWHDQVVPALGSLNFTFVLHSYGTADPPVLTLTETVPSTITLPATVYVRGTVTTSRFDDSISLVSVEDNDVASGRSVWGGSIVSGAPFELEIPQSLLRPGARSFSIYAVDSRGSVSSARQCSTTITGATASPSLSSTMAQTGLPEQTPTPSETPFRTAAPFVIDEFPLDIYPASDGYNFNIVGKEPLGIVSTTLNDTGYRTAAWIGGQGFQIVGCENVSSDDGLIETIIGQDKGEVSIQFQLTNFRAATTLFSIVIAGNLTIGDGPPPGAGRMWTWEQQSPLRVRSRNRQILWETASADSTWIGDLDPDIGTVSDPGYRRSFGHENLTMIRFQTGRLHFSLAVGSLSSETINVKVIGSGARPPPEVVIDSLPATALLGLHRIVVPFHATGLEGQDFLYHLFGVRLDPTLGETQAVVFAHATAYTWSDGPCPQSIDVWLQHPTPPGLYAVYLFTEERNDMMGYYYEGACGVDLIRDVGTLEVLDPAELVVNPAEPPTLEASATPPGTPLPTPAETATESRTPTPLQSPVPTVPQSRPETPRPSHTLTVPQTDEAPPEASQTPTKSRQLYFTASFAVRASRVRRIFQYSYLIPLILNQ
jgi:hypothetical protein